MILLYTAIIVVVLLLCCYLNLVRKLNIITKIPGPKTWPLVGNSLNYMLPPEQLFTYVRLLYHTYKGINQIHSINMAAVNIYDPDDIETILSTTRHNYKQIPYNFLKPWLSEGLLVSNGDKWHQRRKLLTKAFHFNILRKYTQTFVEQTNCFLDKVEMEAGKRTDLFPLITQTTLRIICETTMGTSITDDTQVKYTKYFNSLHEFGETIAQRICRVWYYMDFLFIFSSISRVQRVSLKTLHEFTRNIIQKKKEKHEYIDYTEVSNDHEVYGAKGRLAMLDLLLQNEMEGTIDMDGIQEEVDTFMFEGHDTSAMAISYFIMRIANEPEAQNKIHEEMERIFGNSNRLPSVEDLNDMKYLECCIKESLRLYPSVPFIARFLHQDVTLSGYRVPAGTICHIHVFDVHRNPDIYPQPEQFIPERFLTENIFQRHTYAYIPFSAGPRNCIGQKFAMLQMKTIISGLLRKFRVEPITKSEDIVFRCDIVLRTAHPIFVRFCRR